jgi:hypothetical protein
MINKKLEGTKLEKQFFYLQRSLYILVLKFSSLNKIYHYTHTHTHMPHTIKVKLKLYIYCLYKIR